eukprot:2416401-Rhodomonas_salina.1
MAQRQVRGGTAEGPRKPRKLRAGSRTPIAHGPCAVANVVAQRVVLKYATQRPMLKVWWYAQCKTGQSEAPFGVDPTFLP